MKSTVTREETFTPVTVTLTLENQRELDALYGLLSQGTIDSILVDNGLNLDPVFRSLKGYQTDDYEKTFDALMKLIHRN